MSLTADVETVRGALTIKVSLDVADGEIVALVGPNGAGKTTTLRVLAGLDETARGRVMVDTDTWLDSASGTFVPVHQRELAMMFQEDRLFEHMTVRENVEFSGRVGRTHAEAADRWMARLDLVTLADRRPADLSGGQRQRVSLARALARQPRVCLLDEPLSALDVEARQSVRRLLADDLRAMEVPVIMVTHDGLDAGLVADRVIVLENGRITDSGTFDAITRRPRSAWAASLTEMNMYRGIGGEMAVQVGSVTVVVADPVDGDVLVTIPPRAVALHRSRPTGSPRNVFAGTIATVESHGHRVRVGVDGELPIVAEVTADAARHLNLVNGGDLFVSFKATDILAYDES